MSRKKKAAPGTSRAASKRHTKTSPHHIGPRATLPPHKPNAWRRSLALAAAVRGGLVRCLQTLNALACKRATRKPGDGVTR